MADAHQALSYTISAEDRASTVFRGVAAELQKLQTAARAPLAGLNREWQALGARRPLEFVKADQALQLAKTEEQMRKVEKATQAAGTATKVQAAEMAVLTNRHKVLQAEMDRSVAKHAAMTKAATVGAYGVVGAGAAIVTGAVKQGLAWEKLGKQIEQQTGLSGKSLEGLMKAINATTGTVPYKLEDIAQAAVLLKTRFGESDSQITKTSGLMVGFAKRAGEEVTPAVRGLGNILRQYREPLSNVVGLTDKLVSVSQLTQQPLGAMESTIERFGPKLQAMGFGLNESVRLMGILGQSGVKADQMGRGLSAAYGAAQKALGGAAGPQAALQKQGEAVQKAQERIAALGLTIPKTTTEQQKHDMAVRRANDSLTAANTKYEALKKVVDAAGGSHATTATLVKAWIKEIEHAKSANEAYSLAADHFGRMIGPQFERAFYKNKTAIEATDKALGAHGRTQGLVAAEQKTFEGNVTQLTETWHKTERELGVHLVPTLTKFLKLVGGGVKDIDEFTKHNKLLAEVLGGVAVAGAGGYLMRKPLGAAAGALSHVPGLGGLAKIPGVGGDSGLWGATGFVRPGSISNPLMVRVEGGLRGGGPPVGAPGISTAEKAAAGAGGVGLLSRLGAGARVAGQVGLYMEGLNMALPGGREPIGGHSKGGVAGQFRNWLEDSSAAFTSSFGKLLSGNIGGALGTLFGHNARDDLRSFVDELKKLKRPIAALGSADELTKIQREAEKLGRNKDLEKWAPQLQKIAAEAAASRARVGAAFAGMRSQAEAEVRLLGAKLGPLTVPGTNAMVTAYRNMVTAIRGEMAAGVKATATGTTEINAALKGELRALGIKEPSKQNQSFGAMPGGGANWLQPTAPGGSSGFTGFAKGGRVPGRVGPDNWTLIDPSGRPAAKVGGAELLIANRHTERDASVATQLLYGKSLGQMVAGETRPHSMATGGTVAWRSAVASAESLGGVGYMSNPIQARGYSELSVPPNPANAGSALGHLPYRTAMRIRAGAREAVAAKQDIGAGSSFNPVMGLYPGTVADLGLSGGEFHVLIARADGQPLTGGGAAPGAAAAQIRRVLAKGVHGVIGQIAQGALDRMRAGANARLAAVAARAGGPSASVSAAGAAPTGGGFSPSELGSFDGLQVAKWIIPELAYARAHGWRGHITSGYRPGFDPHASGGSMHALDIYPGGAVDFGGMVDPAGLANRAAFIAATAGYAGKRLLTPIGFRDDGHMSGTGHALGGRVAYAGAFGRGGSVTASRPTLALFGDKGTETAHFLPHAQTGMRVSSSGLAQTEGNNPDTGRVEWHTQDEWHRLRVQHTAKVKREHAEHKRKPPTLEALGAQDLRTLKAQPEGAEGIAAGGPAVAALDKLLAEAKRTGKTSAIGALRKDIETALATTRSRIVKQAEAAPLSLVTQADSAAVGALWRLAQQASKQGARVVEQSIFKDIAKTVTNWRGAITGSLTKTETAAKGSADRDVATRQLNEIRTQGAGARLKTSAQAGPIGAQLLKADQAAGAKAIGELQKEQAAIGKLIVLEHAKLKKLQDKLRRELKRHHKAAAKALGGEIAAINSLLGEAQSESDEVAATIASIETKGAVEAAEHLKAEYDKFKEGIDETTKGLEGEREAIGTRGDLEEGKLHREGKDVAGLEERKSEQGGVLTPPQIAQAQEDLQAFTRRAQEEIAVDRRQKGQQESALSGLSGDDRSSMVKSNESLERSINALENAIWDQTNHTKKLTEATNSQTRVLAGQLSFSYQGQDYWINNLGAHTGVNEPIVGGQSSVSASNISVGN